MININVVGVESFEDFKHMFTPIDGPNELDPIKTKGFYFICSDYLKNNVYRDQIYFCTEQNELFYYSCFNQWNKSHNKQEHFTNLLKLV